MDDGGYGVMAAQHPVEVSVRVQIPLVSPKYMDPVRNFTVMHILTLPMLYGEKKRFEDIPMN